VAPALSISPSTSETLHTNIVTWAEKKTEIVKVRLPFPVPTDGDDPIIHLDTKAKNRARQLGKYRGEGGASPATCNNLWTVGQREVHHRLFTERGVGLNYSCNVMKASFTGPSSALGYSSQSASVAGPILCPAHRRLWWRGVGLSELRTGPR
jgi:hypothetical protein